MRASVAVAAGFCAAVAPVPAFAAREPLVLAPTSDWVLDYADERCTLLRVFGEGENELKVRIDSFGSWTTFRFTVVGELMPKTRRPVGDLKVRFNPDPEDRDVGALYGKAGDARAATFVTYVLPFTTDPPDEPVVSTIEQILADPVNAEFERAANSLRLAFGGGPTVELRLGRLSAPLRAMRSCVDNLYMAWGYNPAVQKTLSRYARPTDTTVRRIQGRYPSNMLRTGSNSVVPVRVSVDAEGNGSNCVILSDVVDEAFRQAVCQGLSAKFEPALDSSGSPIASLYLTTVYYRIF